MSGNAEWQGHVDRWRAERAAYAKRAAAKRREAQELRKYRRWLDALIADDRAAEYRRTRDQLTNEINNARRIYGCR